MQAACEFYATDLAARRARSHGDDLLGKIALRGRPELLLAPAGPSAPAVLTGSSGDVLGGLALCPALGFGDALVSNQDLSREVLVVKEVLARFKIKDWRGTDKKRRKHKKSSRSRCRRGGSSSSGGSTSRAAPSCGRRIPLCGPRRTPT